MYSRQNLKKEVQIGKLLLLVLWAETQLNKVTGNINQIKVPVTV